MKEPANTINVKVGDDFPESNLELSFPDGCIIPISGEIVSVTVKRELIPLKNPVRIGFGSIISIERILKESVNE